MIDMDRPTNFDRTDRELEEFLMVCVCVAGKSAHSQAARLARFLSAGSGLSTNFPGYVSVTAR